MSKTIITKSKYQLNNFSNKEIIVDTFFTLMIFLIMALIIISPKRYTEGTVSGLKLFFFSVLPGLFPFMLLTKLLTELGVLFKFCKKLDRVSYKLFGTPGISFYAFFMSIISGYPIGAKIIADLYGKGLITEKDAKKMSVYCTTSGPIFVIGTVGTIMFGNYLIGIVLYVSHILSSLLLGIIFNLFDRNKQNFNKNNEKVQFFKNQNIVSRCVSETINSLFVVGAYITIFYLLSELLEFTKIFEVCVSALSPLFKALKIDTELCRGVVYGILEVTRGAKVLSSSPIKASVVLASGILSFSGLSIIFQSMAFLKTAKIKTQTFILVKFVHFIFSMIICFLLSLVIRW